MIKLESYIPTHIQMSRIEHGIATNRHRYYALRESGILDIAEEVRLDLEFLNMCYWKYRGHTPERKEQGK